MENKIKTIAEELNIKEFPFEVKDVDGNLIYCETSDGHWFKSNFDNNGNVIYRENSNNTWVKNNFDDNGRRTYCEYSHGYWCKWEYDNQGDVTYYESSTNGVIQDNRPKPTCEGKVVDIGGKKYKLTEIKVK